MRPYRRPAFPVTLTDDGHRVCRPGSPAFYRLDTYHPCTYLCHDLSRGPCRGPYPSVYPYPCLSPCLVPGRRRTSIWEAFDCAWLATETAVKSGETVLPSYVVYLASMIYLFVPFCQVSKR